MLGVVVVVASFFTLSQVVSALIRTRILIQFVGQIAAVHWLMMHGTRPGFRMALYPLPTLVALAGWIYIIVTSGDVGKWLYRGRAGDAGGRHRRVRRVVPVPGLRACGTCPAVLSETGTSGDNFGSL